MFRVAWSWLNLLKTIHALFKTAQIAQNYSKATQTTQSCSKLLTLLKLLTAAQELLKSTQSYSKLLKLLKSCSKLLKLLRVA